jgi:hypothetical protein
LLKKTTTIFIKYDLFITIYKPPFGVKRRVVEGKAHGMNPVGSQRQVVNVQGTLCGPDEGVDHVVEGGGHQLVHAQDVHEHKGGEVTKKAGKVGYGLWIGMGVDDKKQGK